MLRQTHPVHHQHTPTANMTEATSSNTPASLIKRFAAGVYDGFLVFAISWTYFAAVLAFKNRFLHFDVETSPTAGGDPLSFIGLILVIYLFYAWCWIHNGQTLGMQAWRLKLKPTDGSDRLQWHHTAKRFFADVFSLSILGLGFWISWFRTDRLSLPDILSSTVIVLEPKNKT